MSIAIDLRALSSAAPVLAVAGHGRDAIASDGDVIRIVGGRALVSAAGVVGAAVLEGAIWIVMETNRGHALHRFDLAGSPMAPPAALGALGAQVTLEVTRIGLRSALIEGARAVYVRERGDELVVDDLGPQGRDRRVLMGGRGVMERRGSALVLGRPGGGVQLALPLDLAAGRVAGGAMVFDGTCAMIEVETAGGRTVIVYELARGTLRARARLGSERIVAVAERRGMLVLGRGPHVALLDLRAGRCVGERVLRSPVAAAAIDANGARLLVVDEDGDVCEVEAGHWTSRGRAGGEPDCAQDANPVAPAPEGELATVEPAARSGTGGDAGSAEPAGRTGGGSAEPAGRTGGGSAEPAGRTGGGSAEPAGRSGAGVDAEPTATRRAAGAAEVAGRSGAEVDTEPTATRRAAEAAEVAATGCIAPRPRPVTALDDELAEAGALELVALGPALRCAMSSDELDEHLGDARTWVSSLCRRALARAAASGRGERAIAELDAARTHERDAAERLERWRDREPPHVAIARELGLSPLASKVLLLIAAPQIWGELRCEYGACVADAERPVIDELLLAHLLDAAATSTRTMIGRELDEDAPLVRTGAVEVGSGVRPYAALCVHPALARRLAGAGPATDPAATARAARSLPEIIGPRAAIADLARRLARPAAEPVRVVLRGRAGAGRRTVAAALAAQAGRGLVPIAIDGATDELEPRLRQRLCEAALRGDLPCVVLDGLADDPAVRARIREVLDAHLGPVFVRAPRGGELPLAPGYHAVDFAPLTETEQRIAWERTLAAHALDATPSSALAARFAVGPGAIERVCAAVAAGPAPAALEPALAAAVRQHRSARIEAIAKRIEPLASWHDLIVPDDISDALRELCARVHHRRTVLEDWGLGGIAKTARGVTALFQGGPGTGKTMAAEVVAQALGYELWRVDLSKVVSKWIGETEKNLAAVFDAAEDGEIVLLFDEADSLFGKRTEVKSSHDRNANLEINYLLQRLDTFTGIAILTTNFGTAIDPAFRRRLSVQVEFPFPDEADRERLWRVHLPPAVPMVGELDLAALARRFQLTGGYIRNAVLRAAYLAASRGTPVSAADLERAVRSEYLARGKVSATGALS